jgi:hypothetical protein
VDELYVVARRVLLDALDALGSHRDAVIVVGAHAVYMRVGEADLSVAPHTTDGDLAIDPARLSEIPPLEQALADAGFLPKTADSVGVWITHRPTADNPNTEVAIDLLVPASVSPGKGRRAARLRGHDSRAARIVRGLDGVIVDADTMMVSALEPSDARAFEMRVAGPGALLVAKVHKIQDRVGTARATDKDALDVLRILRGTSTSDLAARMTRVLDDDNARPVAEGAVELLRQQFADRAGEGIAMAVRAAGSLEDAEEIAASCELLASDLLGELARCSGAPAKRS